MKKFVLLIFLISLISCIKNPAQIELKKYSKEDFIPLNDSTKSLYQDDAAYIEFGQVIQDSIKRYDKVNLDGQNIMAYYEDLLNIYYNSYSIGNSFFENISRIHSSAVDILYYLVASVEAHKVWVEEWLNGNTYTGIVGIDSLIENYSMDVFFNYGSSREYNFTLKTKVPINYFALRKKLERTNEFMYVEPTVQIGEGSSISLAAKNDHRIYQYTLAWGDCPSGCLYSHIWKIKVTEQVITLLEEYGDPLR